MSDKPWWFPVLADHQWANRIRADYPENTVGMDDEAIQDQYADGWKYADVWDHLGDARAAYEKLADDYLQKINLLDRVRSECEVDYTMRFDPDRPGDPTAMEVSGPPAALRALAELLSD